MVIQLYVELEHLSGSEQDRDTMIDALCGTIGQQNGAPKPLRIEVGNADGETVSVYQVKLADDRLF